LTLKELLQGKAHHGAFGGLGLVLIDECSQRLDESQRKLERLGHSKVAVTLDTYSHLLPTMQDGAASQLESLLHQRKPENGHSQATVGKAASS